MERDQAKQRSLQALLLAVLGVGLAAPAQAQVSSMQDFEWTLTNGSSGVAELDLVAGTMFLFPQTPDFVQPFMTYTTVAPYDGTITVGVTTVSHDPTIDAAIRVVGDTPAAITAFTGSIVISFDVFADTTFGLGVEGDDCCGSIEVLFHDFVFAPKTPTPAVAPALDVRLEQTASALYADRPKLDAIGDVNDDGITDLVLGGVNHPTPYWANSTTYYLAVLSGADLSTLFSISGDFFANIGEFVSGCGDFDLDGIPDYLSGNVYACKVRSGRNNAVLATFINGNYSGNMSQACGAGDIDLDGIPDLWIMGGALQLVSGADGSVIHSHPLPNPGAQTNSKHGDILERLGDVDGDGVDDVVVGRPPQALLTVDSRVRIVSGATGLLIREYLAAPAALLGYAVSSAGDVDGDGVDDVLAGAPGGFGGRGEAFVWSGATGAELHHFVGSVAYGGLGGAVDGAGDVNADGLADVLIGNRANENPNAQPDGRVELRSGADGALLQVFEQNAEADFGRALKGGVDLDLDGEPELVVAALRDGPNGKISRYDDLTLPYGVSSLTATGALLPGTPFMLRLLGGPPAGVAHLVAGFAWIAAPFKGGTLIPQPDILLPGLPLGPQGSLSLPGTWPSGVPSGTLLAFQCWIPDAHGPAGFGASNGVLFLVP
jgi:hypothetical protein